MASTLTVSLFSLDPEIQIDDTPLIIPQNSSILDLNELANSLTTTPSTFDFFIENQLISTTLQQFLATHNTNTELTVQITCSPSPNPPKLLSQQDTPDWGSSITMSSDSIFVTSYDGSISIFSKDLTPLKTISVSSHPLKTSFFAQNTLFAAGYDGNLVTLQNEEIAKSKHEGAPFTRISGFQDGIFAFDENFDVFLQSGVESQIVPQFSLSQFAPGDLFEFGGNFVMNCGSALKFYDVVKGQAGFTVPGPCQCKDFVYRENMIFGGYMDRAVRVFDVRAPQKVVRTFLGHKSHVIRVNLRNEHQFVSSDIAGVSYLWDDRSSRPYHCIESYDRSIDRKNDQGRVLDAKIDGNKLYLVGSARKIFQYEL